MKHKIACIQMCSGADIAANIDVFERRVAEATAKGAQLVATPENTFLMESPHGERVRFGQDQHPGMAAASEMAKKHKLWLLVGSVSVIPSAAEGSLRSFDSAQGRSAQDDNKTYNRSILFNPDGAVAAHYDKIHLFDVEVGDGQNYRESAKMLAGEKIVVVELRSDGVMGEKNSSPPLQNRTTPLPRLGLTVCYDLRFPHLYRALAKAGAEILAVPSAFTQVTGEAHWHVLLRARAIENGCFVIAPAQCGTHPGNRKTYGHSLIVNPWGEVIADGGTEEGVVMAEIDLGEVAKARGRIPSLGHDREFN